MVLEDTGGIDHGFSEEPVIEIISSIVDITDVSLVHGLVVVEGVLNQGIEEELEVVKSEGELEQIISVEPDFHEFLLQVNLGVDVELLDCLDWDFLTLVLSQNVGFILDIFLPVFSGELILINIRITNQNTNRDTKNDQ